MKRKLFVLLFSAFCLCSCIDEPGFTGSVNFYPNPFEDVLSADISVSQTTTVEISLYSSRVEGQFLPSPGDRTNPIFSGRINGGETRQVQFNLSDLEEGLYFFDVTAEGRTSRYQIVKGNLQ